MKLLALDPDSKLLKSPLRYAAYIAGLGANFMSKQTYVTKIARFNFHLQAELDPMCWKLLLADLE